MPFKHNQFSYIIHQTHHILSRLCHAWPSFYTLPHTSRPPPTPSAPSLSSTWNFPIWIAAIQFHDHSTPAKLFLQHAYASLPSRSYGIKFILLYLRDMLPSSSQDLQTHIGHKTSPKHHQLHASNSTHETQWAFNSQAYLLSFREEYRTSNSALFISLGDSAATHTQLLTSPYYTQLTQRKWVLVRDESQCVGFTLTYRGQCLGFPPVFFVIPITTQSYPWAKSSTTSSKQKWQLASRIHHSSFILTLSCPWK